MTLKTTPEMKAVGTQLRTAIRDNRTETGRTYRHLSRALGREDNYLSSYLRTPVENWAIPKHPTYSLLLSELGTSEDELLEKATQAATAQCDEVKGDKNAPR